MSNGQVMDLTTVCHSFPDMPNPLISRDYLLINFKKIFSGATELVVLEGDEGIGKTILLAQFAIKSPLQTFSLFIKPTSRWAYDPESLRFDLCNQIHWLLRGTELDINEGVDDTFLRRSWASLQTYAIQRNIYLFFIVDGLDEIPEEESQIRKIIIDMLPFGYSAFRFLLSGEPSKILQNVSPKVLHKASILAGFSLEETIEYLRDLPVDKSVINDIYSLCGGNPGYLASIRRILEESDVDIHTLLDEMPDKLSRLFEVEWRRVNISDHNQKQLLAFIAFAQKGYAIHDLSRMLILQETDIYNTLQRLKFITVNQQSGEVNFVSEPFRKFVCDQLQYLKDSTYDLVISDLLKYPEGDDALVYLPSYLDKTERFSELVTYLSLDHCTKMVERSQSLIPVEQKTELGVKAARQLKRDGDLMRFGVQGSLLAEIDGSEVWKSEIEARMALNDYNTALTLAQSNVLKEDRLHLLSIIAKTQKEQRQSIDESLVTQIKQLYEQIDRTTLGKRAIEIAADLIYSIPDLAIKLVEESTNTEESDNALDWAFARLSVVTLGANREKLKSADAMENIYSYIKDPNAIRLSATATLLHGEYSAIEVLIMTEKFDSVGDRLYMLRLWAIENRERDDAIKVVEFALSLIIETTAYAPNAKVIREIASPLPFIQDKEKLKQLVASFDSQKGTIERFGPTQDYVRLQLILAQAETNYDMLNASTRIIETYFYIAHLEDLVIKSECLAWLVGSITQMDPSAKSRDLFGKDEMRFIGISIICTDALGQLLSGE